MLRFIGKFTIAALIGVGATLGWQAYGDVAREMLVARAPAMAWLLSVSGTKSSTVAATSASRTQQLEPLMFNLDAVRRSVEQLAARQDQMTQSIMALQAVEEDIRQKISLTPPSLAQAPQAAAVPQPKPAQPKPPLPAAQPSSAPRPPSPAGPVVLTH
jgi:hypothetical protein